MGVESVSVELVEVADWAVSAAAALAVADLEVVVVAGLVAGLARRAVR